MNLENIKKEFSEEIEQVQDLKALEVLRVKYLGRKGIVAEFLTALKDMPEAMKKQKGKEINMFKREIEIALEEKRQLFSAKGARLPMTGTVGQGSASGGQKKEWIDVTAPGVKHPKGHLHPRTIVMRQVENIFQSMGFSIVGGPELETDWYNFEALNIPQDHPARDMQDTFYVSNPSGEADLIMRTHTSPVQIRYMEKNNPPLRIIVPGRVFRREATDASHDYQFYQVEGLMVDKNISVANFKAVIEEFFKRFYGKKVEVRLRPSYFPFTEPSFEIDISCVFCDPRTRTPNESKLHTGQASSMRGKKKGCRICSQGGWLEIAGAGMVNQIVFESAGYARNEWQGFAFGFGFERLVMMKYKIDDIRLLNSGDLRFLKQF